MRVGHVERTSDRDYEIEERYNSQFPLVEFIGVENVREGTFVY